MAEIDPRSFIFNVLDPGRDHGQNRPQNLHFQRFGPLGRTMAKMDPRSLILDLLGAWAELWPHNRSQKLDVRRFDSLGGAMVDIDPRNLIFNVLDWASRLPGCQTQGWETFLALCLGIREYQGNLSV